MRIAIENIDLHLQGLCALVDTSDTSDIFVHLNGSK